jgi:hypothetical protein
LQGEYLKTLIIFPSDGRTINWQQRGAIKVKTFSFQKKDKYKTAIKILFNLGNYK